MVAIPAVMAAVAWLGDRRAPDIVGSARIIDGDSVAVAGVEIRIYGIDAPEYRQFCFRSGRSWPCGRTAKDALRALVDDREVTCRPRDQDRYGRTVAVCRVRGLDLGAAMVSAGNAVAYGAYNGEEQAARAARRGIWSSSFERPAAWRAHHRYLGSHSRSLARARED